MSGKRALEPNSAAPSAPPEKTQKSSRTSYTVDDLLRDAPAVLQTEIQAGRLTRYHPYGQQLAYIAGILTGRPIQDLWEEVSEFVEVGEAVHSMKPSSFHCMRGVEAERATDNWWDNINFPFPCETTIAKNRPKMKDLKINGCYPENFVRLWERNKDEFIDAGGAYTATVIDDDVDGSVPSHKKILVHLHGCGDKMSIHPTTGHGVWSYDKGSEVSTVAIAYNFLEAADPQRWNDPEALAAPGFRLWHQLADQVVEQLLAEFKDLDEIPHTELKTRAFKLLRSQLASGLYVVIWTPRTLQSHVRQKKHPSIIGGAFLIGKEDAKITKEMVLKTVRFLDTCGGCMKEKCGADKCCMDDDLMRCERCVEKSIDCVVFRPTSMSFDGAAFNRILPDVLRDLGIPVYVDPSHAVKGFFNSLRNWGIQIDSLESVVQMMPLLAALTANEAAGSKLLRQALGSGWSLLSADQMHHSVIQAFASPLFDDLYRELKYVVYVGAPAVTRFSSTGVVPQRRPLMKALVGMTPLGWSMVGRGYLYWSSNGISRVMSHTNPRSKVAGDVRMKTTAIPGMAVRAGAEAAGDGDVVMESAADDDRRVGLCEFKSNTGDLRSFFWSASKVTGSDVFSVSMNGIHKDEVVFDDVGFLDDEGLALIMAGKAVPINAKALSDSEWIGVLGNDAKVHRIEASRSAYVPCLLDVFVLLNTGVLLVFTTHTHHTGTNVTLPPGWTNRMGQCLVGVDTTLVSIPGYQVSRQDRVPALGSWRVAATSVRDFDVVEGALMVSFSDKSVYLWEDQLFVDRLKISQTRGDYVIECVRTEQYLAREQARVERARQHLSPGDVGGIHARVEPATSPSEMGRSTRGGTLRLDRVPWIDQLDELWSGATTFFRGWASIRSTVSRQVFLWTQRGVFAVLSDWSLETITSGLFSKTCLGRASSAFIGVPTLSPDGVVEHGLLPHGGDAVCVTICGCRVCRAASMLNPNVPNGDHPQGTAGRAGQLPSTLFDQSESQCTPVLLVIQSTTAIAEVSRRVGDFLLATGEAKETAGPGPNGLNNTIGGKKAVYTASLAVAQLLLGVELESWRLPGRFVYEQVNGVRTRSFDDSGNVSPMNLSSTFWAGEMRRTFNVSWGGRRSMFPVSLLRAFLGTLRALSVTEERMRVAFVRYGSDGHLKRALEETRFVSLILCFAYLSSMLCEWLFGRIRVLHAQPGRVAGSAVWSVRRLVMDGERSRKDVVTQAPRRRSTKLYGAGPGHGSRWATTPVGSGRSTIAVSHRSIRGKLNSFAVPVGRRSHAHEPNNPPPNVDTFGGRDEDEEDEEDEDECVWDRTSHPTDCECGCNDDDDEPGPPLRHTTATSGPAPLVTPQEREIRAVVEDLLRACSAQHQMMPDRWAFTKFREAHCHHAN